MQFCHLVDFVVDDFPTQPRRHPDLSLVKSEYMYMQKPQSYDWGFNLEAPPRFELGIKVLQTSALPLGYGAVNIETDYISNLSHFFGAG